MAWLGRDRRGRRDRGAGLVEYVLAVSLVVTRRRRSTNACRVVELSIVALFVFVLFLAFFEFGLLFRDNLTATDTVADATPIGAIIGPVVVEPASSTADFAIVKPVRDGLSAGAAPGAG